MPETLIPRERLPIRHLLVFGWLPGPLKRWAYRTFRGYRIGRHVKLAFGSVIEGKNVDIGDHVEIGLLAIVIGRDIRIGRHSSIGTMSYLSCPRIEIGEDARIREQVSVGGPELPESRFCLGSRTVILQRTSINPTKPVIIGDDTGIGGHCLIFTHGAWLNNLDGYPVSYEPVTLGKSVWLPWRVFVMPGASIGDGTVIAANSLVMGSIPPSALAAGSPARVLKQAPDFPRVPDREGRNRLVGEIVSEFDRMLQHEGVRIREDLPFRTFSLSGRSHRLLWIRDETGSVSGAERGDTVLTDVVLTPDQLGRFRRDGIYWLDLAGKTRSEAGGPLTEELAVFLGRYGIRLARDGSA